MDVVKLYVSLILILKLQKCNEAVIKDQDPYIFDSKS